jgi:hypothetical protein
MELHSQRSRLPRFRAGSGADFGGLAFAATDDDDYWCLIANKSSGQFELYEVSGGTWTLKRSGGERLRFRGDTDDGARRCRPVPV